MCQCLLGSSTFRLVPREQQLDATPFCFPKCICDRFFKKVKFARLESKGSRAPSVSCSAIFRAGPQAGMPTVTLQTSQMGKKASASKACVATWEVKVSGSQSAYVQSEILRVRPLRSPSSWKGPRDHFFLPKSRPFRHRH